MKLSKIFEYLFKRHSIVKTEKSSSVFNQFTKGKPVVESSVPASCEIGNMLFHKDYDKAILAGEEIVTECPDDYFAHCNLMSAFFEAKDIEKCNEEAKLAIIKGHHTGYCENRLSINLFKQKKYHQVIQLSEVLENPRANLHFIDVHKRKLRALKYIEKALDTENDKLFTEEEIEELYENIEKLKKLRAWYIATRKELHDKCFNKENIRRMLNGDEATQKLVEKYHSLIQELDDKYRYLI